MGQLMHLQLGEVSAVIVSFFPDVAKQILKTHDLAFATRSNLVALDSLLYDGLISPLAPTKLGLDVADIFPSYKFLHGLSGAKQKLVNAHLKSSLPITNDNVKAVIVDLFTAGTETSSTTIVWAMAEMMKNPIILAKAQAEVL
ncbi:hypothetical protein HAX54_044504 [Datura stramonium]|uniref:Cytochrome P450 n=1 Tax=Datura stramonium TaxID=4076 RepID=A0ABS8SPX5_DATST|nr:hypothetical protein [Datura stramonium]